VKLKLSEKQGHSILETLVLYKSSSIEIIMNKLNDYATSLNGEPKKELFYTIIEKIEKRISSIDITSKIPGKTNN